MQPMPSTPVQTTSQSTTSTAWPVSTQVRSLASMSTSSQCVINMSADIVATNDIVLAADIGAIHDIDPVADINSQRYRFAPTTQTGQCTIQ
jgi:hypothetical protein